MKINNIPDEQLESQLKYLKLLSKQYPSISSASAEIINLEAVLSLPKGTEHFYLIYMVNMNHLCMY